MRSKKIYIFRHGETDFNKKGIVQGKGVDSSLNERGREQRNAFFDSYKNIPFEIAYTSVLKRTVETIQPFLELGIPNEPCEELNEIGWGVHEGKSNAAQGDFFQQVLEQWRQGNTGFALEGGESPDAVQERLKSFTQKIIDSKEETILICSHGRAMRIFLCHLLHYPLACMDAFPHANTGLYLLNYHNSFSVALHNDIRHLESIGIEEHVG